MNDENKKQEFLLLFRNYEWDKELSADEAQQTLDKFMGWFESLQQTGKVLSGKPLNMGGKVVTGKDAKVADGPYAESKEEIGGFFLLRVDTMEEAVEIARQCPTLGGGCAVEVREVAAECETMKRLKERKMAEASA